MPQSTQPGIPPPLLLPLDTLSGCFLSPACGLCLMALPRLVAAVVVVVATVVVVIVTVVVAIVVAAVFSFVFGCKTVTNATTLLPATSHNPAAPPPSPLLLVLLPSVRQQEVRIRREGRGAGCLLTKCKSKQRHRRLLMAVVLFACCSFCCNCLRICCNLIFYYKIICTNICSMRILFHAQTRTHMHMHIVSWPDWWLQLKTIKVESL